MQLSSAIIDFSLFYDGAVDVTRSQCTVSDTSGGSMKNREALYCFSSEDCFDAHSHIPYAFVVRVENKIHIVNIEC